VSHSAGWFAVAAAMLALAGCGGASGRSSVAPDALTAVSAAPVPAPDPVGAESGPLATHEPRLTSAPPTPNESSTAFPISTRTPTSAPASSTLAPAVRSGENVSASPSVGDPIAISIPDLGVDSWIVPTGVLEDGSVAVPPDASIAGWFAPGPRPGERGPAVIMGHFDSRKTGPGVFYRLRDLQVGSTVTVETTTGPIDFVVRSVEQFPKDRFPTALVYGPVPEPALRLITCGGSFDYDTRHYRDNVVAFLVLADSA
jgi:hypothetical protein